MVVNDDAINCEILLGMVVHSDQMLYNDYATQTRFCVRKDNGICKRKYICSKEGF